MGKRRVIVSLAATSCLAVLVFAALTVSDRILENWYIAQLRTGDAREQDEAAERLCVLGTERVASPLVQFFLARIAANSQRLEDPRTRKTTFILESTSRNYIRRILELQEKGIPTLLRSLESEDENVRLSAGQALQYLSGISPTGWRDQDAVRYRTWWKDNRDVGVTEALLDTIHTARIGRDDLPAPITALLALVGLRELLLAHDLPLPTDLAGLGDLSCTLPDIYHDLRDARQRTRLASRLRAALSPSIYDVLRR